MIGPEWTLLEWAGLTAYFDPATLGIRRISAGKVELIRSIYVALRDQNWGTIPGKITNFQHQMSPDGFVLKFHVHHFHEDIDFHWEAEVVAQGRSLKYRMDGVSHSSFLTNRLGFCVLHPIRECAGQPCRVTHTDGAVTQGHFPASISPHQPFFGISALEHVALDQIPVRVEFEGDIFEMEDQRNWTDASFKTYCTPLAIPFPAQIKEGDTVAQKVSLTVGEFIATAVDGQAAPCRIRFVPGLSKQFPKVGACLPDLEIDASALASLGLDHVRVDANDLDGAAELCRVAGCSLEVSIQEGHESSEFGDLPIARFLVCGPDVGDWANEFRRMAPVIVGAEGNFADLNRNRPVTSGADGLFFSINPQVHAFDDASIMETLEGQIAALVTAREFANDLLIIVSPVTLLPRTKPISDPRQSTAFGAAWLLGTLAGLTEEGVASVTIYDTHGPKGLIDTPAGTVLAQLLSLRGGEVLTTESDDPDWIAAMLFRTPRGYTWFVGNLTPEPVEVLLELVNDPIHLAPFEVRKVEVSRGIPS
ncbi:MAG: hypothetical protein ACOYON_10765 [Fimbriimonas sp.]